MVLVRGLGEALAEAKMMEVVEAEVDMALVTELAATEVEAAGEDEVL